MVEQMKGEMARVRQGISIRDVRLYGNYIARKERCGGVGEKENVKTPHLGNEYSPWPPTYLICKYLKADSMRPDPERFLIVKYIIYGYYIMYNRADPALNHLFVQHLEGLTEQVHPRSLPSPPKTAPYSWLEREPKIASTITLNAKGLFQVQRSVSRAI